MTTKSQQRTDRNVKRARSSSSNPVAAPRRRATDLPFRAIPTLSRGNDEIGSRRTPIAISVAIHVVLALVLILMPARFANKADDEKRIDIVFHPRELQEPEAPPPAPPKPKPEPQPQPVDVAELEPPPLPEPAPVEPPRQRQAPPPPPVSPPIARTQPPPRPEPKKVVPAPPRPKPRTGGFSKPDVVAEARPKPRKAAAKLGGFATTPAESPQQQPKSRVVASGQFSTGDIKVPKAEPRKQSVMPTSFTNDSGQAAETSPRPKAQVQTNGFGSAPAEEAQPTRSAPRRVASTGFTSESAPADGTEQRSASVSKGAFGQDVAATTRRKREKPSEKLDTPVEVISKPAPVYTTDARELRIEGEVALEVTFLASGEIRVLRVVRGLGHGLDEAAVDAAKKIEFKPARRNGQPVDHTATLRVVFKLA